MEVSGQLHVPAALPPREQPQVTHWIERCASPTAGLDAWSSEALLAPTGNRTPGVQLVVHHYTN
jgi:hypothetical protein